MPVLLLLFLTLACLPETWPKPAWIGGPLASMAFTWAGVALEVLFAAFVSSRTNRALRTPSAAREAILKDYMRGRWLHTLGLFLTYGLALYAFGYGWAIHSLWSSDAGNPLPGTEV